jgi:hypothetical protein
LLPSALFGASRGNDPAPIQGATPDDDSVNDITQGVGFTDQLVEPPGESKVGCWAQESGAQAAAAFAITTQGQIRDTSIKFDA